MSPGRWRRAKTGSPRARTTLGEIIVTLLIVCRARPDTSETVPARHTRAPRHVLSVSALDVKTTRRERSSKCVRACVRKRGNERARA
eukprot:294009-Rhodomonas_salina.1